MEPVPGGWAAVFRPETLPKSRLRVEGSPAPLRTSFGDRQVVFDGFLANRRELDRELDLEGGPTTTDATRVLAAWDRFGSAVVDRLRGGFAVLLYDSRTTELTVLRDPVGLHPVFYAEAGQATVVSPHVEVLLGHPRISAGLDRVVLAEYLLDRFGDAEETFWQGIRRLPGGCRLCRGPRGARVERYWDPVPAESEGWIEDEVEARFEEAFEMAVARCRSVGSAAVFLSGGLDSVSVAAVARDQALKGADALPLALSLGFPHPEIDEEETQRRVASRLGLELVAMDFHRAAEPGGGFLASALETCRGWPGPLLNFWLPLYARLAREGVQRGADVLLTGTGGDEWLSVTPYRAADLWRGGDVLGVWRLGRSYLRSQRLSAGRVALNLLWRFAWRPNLLAAVQRRRPGWFAQLRARRWARRLPDWLVPDPELHRRLDLRVRERSARLGPPAGGFYRHELRRGLTHPLPLLELEETFEAGRRVGAGWLHPYLDSDLIDLLARVSPEVLVGDGWSKGLSRSLLRRRFPELDVDRQKKAHVDRFFRDLWRREGPAAVRRCGAPRALDALGLVRTEGASAFLVATIEGKARDAGALHRAWQILHLEEWLR